ncbi:heparinase II/III family protein [Cognatiyoonia sp. IB215446]|uniref:heparinase II/III family protein n=1 Tax=Cognatiyoonia sp. IB215446 TaxID=3097355 RepID=UPI002A1744FF|nr:heparinase II/III family protein [Cognatiyoonia sp. IB215446]MDX8349950.1 heparinase II/III family protein [Cognatiyoonia sp. IB215446]
MHRVHARRAGRADAATAFVSAPEPRSIGVVARGRQLIAGNFLFSGLLVEGPQLSIWDIADQKPEVADEIHGCTWLDDLAAVGDDRARTKAQRWVFDWIARYGKGKGPGWTPDLTGRRVIRWINHGFFLLRNQDKVTAQAFFESLARQTLFLSRRWQTAAPGLPRFEALAGTIYAGLSLEGMEDQVARAVAALAQDCATQIDEEGGIVTRNPEELLEVLTLLNWTIDALRSTDRDVPPDIMRALIRVVPTLRALRHADGSLARFHGGGAGVDGRLEHAFAASGVKDVPQNGLHMGFARLTGARTTLIIDAAAPPQGNASAFAHASTLGMEVTSGRRPLIVGCGSGERFGDEWRRASRATPSHSLLSLDGVSSSHLGKAAELLTEVPTITRANLVKDRTLELSHNGYQLSHGLTYARILTLSVDGRMLEGEELLTTLSDTDKSAFDRAMNRAPDGGLGFSVRFHLHPDVEPWLDLGDTAVSLTLKSGEVWVLRHDGVANLTLAPSVYLQKGRLKPRATQQVVLSGRAMSYATRVRWSLAKAQDTPRAVRDLVQEDPMDATY